MLDFLTLDTWITSDSHWEHDNIRIYQDRPFNHFETMREKWIELVQPDDTIFHLGDLVCFGDREKHPAWLDGLTGEKYLLRGNHDKHTDQWYGAAGFTVLGRKPLYAVVDDKIVCFSHEPEAELGGWEINVHGHIHHNPHHPDVDRHEDRRNVCVEMTNFAPVRLRDVLANNLGGAA